jgi:hypothetical protein
MVRCLAFLSFALLISLPAVALPISAEPAVGDVATLQSAETGLIEFTIITEAGYVSFSVPENWRVISMRSQLPVAAAGFQMPDGDDVGTPDATNVSMSLIQAETDQGKRALSLVGQSYEGKVTKSSDMGWDIYEQEAHQGETMYTIVDAKKKIADVVVATRIAWPHLTSDISKHNKVMKDVFDKLLRSIQGSMGVYKRKQGDVVRHPVP